MHDKNKFTWYSRKEILSARSSFDNRNTSVLVYQQNTSWKSTAVYTNETVTVITGTELRRVLRSTTDAFLVRVSPCWVHTLWPAMQPNMDRVFAVLFVIDMLAIGVFFQLRVRGMCCAFFYTCGGQPPKRTTLETYSAHPARLFRPRENDSPQRVDVVSEQYTQVISRNRGTLQRRGGESRGVVPLFELWSIRSLIFSPKYWPR